MARHITIDFDDLLLDHQNPRLGSVESQPEALRELVQIDPKKFAEMMKSIKDNGLDPGNLFFLIDESSELGIEGYTVVDGNRRCAALQVLREPAILVGAGLAEATVRNLRAAADGFDATKIGDERLCVLFANRAEADDWITRRHARDRGGEGQVFWGPLEIQRFTGDKSILDILDFVDRSGVYDPAAWIKATTKLRKRSSVLRRFVDSRAGAQALGLSEEATNDGGKRPMSTRDPVYLGKLLKRLFDDIIAARVTTRTHNKADEIKAYFDGLEPELKPSNAAKAAKPKAFHDLHIKPKKSNPPPPPASPPPSPPPMKPRDTLAPAQRIYQLPASEKGKQFVSEAMKIKLVNYPLSAAFLLRGLIQHVVDAYMRDNGMPFRAGNKQFELHVRAEHVIDHLIANGRAKASPLNGIRRKLSEPAKKNAWSIQALNDYHHDEYQVPTEEALRKGWNDAEALFVAVLGRAN